MADALTGDEGALDALALTVERLRRKLADAQESAEAGALIGMATGILVARGHGGPAEAARHLRELASAARLPPAEVAADIVDAAAGDAPRRTPAGRGGGRTTEVRRLRAAEAGTLSGDTQTAAEALLRQALAPLGATALALWQAHHDGSLTLAGQAGLSRRWPSGARPDGGPRTGSTPVRPRTWRTGCWTRRWCPLRRGAHPRWDMTPPPRLGAVCGLYDPGTGVLRWARAGHPPPVLVHRGQAEVLPLPRGILLGAVAETSYEERELTLTSGDWLLMYTDGLVERRGVSVERSLAQLLAWEHAPPELDEQLDRLLTHSRSDTDDDTCLVGIEVL